LSWDQKINNSRTEEDNRTPLEPGDLAVPKEPEQEPLILSEWVPVGRENEKLATNLLALIRPWEDSVRHVEQALRSGARRSDLSRWLSRHLDDDYLAPSRGAMMARRMLALLALDSPRLLERCHREAREVDSELAAILQPFVGNEASSE